MQICGMVFVSAVFAIGRERKEEKKTLPVRKKPLLAKSTSIRKQDNQHIKHSVRHMKQRVASPHPQQRVLGIGSRKTICLKKEVGGYFPFENTPKEREKGHYSISTDTTYSAPVKK